MQKLGVWGKYLYVNHTLFILYLEGNHTLFGEKLYFIWKFSSGNTTHCNSKTFMAIYLCFVNTCMLNRKYINLKGKNV